VCLADAGDNQLVADLTRAIRGAVRDALPKVPRPRRLAGDGGPAARRAPGVWTRRRAVRRSADAVEHIRGFRGG
jgi:hypothetical protein